MMETLTGRVTSYTEGFSLPEACSTHTCMRERERERCVRERKCVCACVRERERECVCV